MRLGVPRRQAIRHGKSRKGDWHMAKTIASGVGMTNRWLQEQGLISLKSLWAQLAPHWLLTTRVEPPGADPLAWWCGEGGQRWPPLPDLAILMQGFYFFALASQYVAKQDSPQAMMPPALLVRRVRPVQSLKHGLSTDHELDRLKRRVTSIAPATTANTMPIPIPSQLAPDLPGSRTLLAVSSGS